jgi:hypothetical protein
MVAGVWAYGPKDAGRSHREVQNEVHKTADRTRRPLTEVVVHHATLPTGIILLLLK